MTKNTDPQRQHQTKAWVYAIASVGCSALAVPLFFLILPIVLFPAVGSVLCFMSGHHYLLSQPSPRWWVVLLLCLPLCFAGLVCWAGFTLVVGNYRA